MFDNDTCVVTGASRGIGRGIAEHLAGEGASVAVNYRSSPDAAREVVEAIRTDGGEAVAVQADVTSFEAVERMREEVHDAFGPVDILVNNAGVTHDTTFAKMSREEWNGVIDVHLNGMFNATKVFFEDVKAADAGRLINVSSIVGKQGNFGQSNYATAKSGMFGFTRTLALELAPSGSTANCIAPGFTRTDMLAQVDEEIREQIRGEIPLGRFATVDDVASLVAFLASERASYITGEIIDVNGGMDL
ncbi:MAG: beta-ketoacyl-ACP reductase [Haloferacaceae archaeon]